jgi:hypothetical protein
MDEESDRWTVKDEADRLRQVASGLHPDVSGRPHRRGPMDVQVKLSDIIGSMEFRPGEATLYLNADTGKIISVTPDEFFEGDADDPIEDYPDWQQDGVQAARKLTRGNDGNLLELPGKWDVNEYQIMEDFCLSLPAGNNRTSLYASMQGRGAFRRFKDAVEKVGVADKWHHYRTSRFKTVAVDWCRANEIDFEDDVGD